MQNDKDNGINMTNKISVKHLIVLLLAGLFFSHQLNAALILTAPPRESKEQGEKLYGPLAKYLTQLLGEEVVYKYPRGWLRYQRDIRRNVFDIVFDGPHFASWRMEHKSHSALVKLPGTLDFYFITRKSRTNIKIPEDLVHKKVCVIPPPNLTSLVLLDVLNSPTREPILKSVKGGMFSLYKQLNNNACDAAVVRKDFFDKKLTEEQRAPYKIIYTSKPIPNQVITASDRVDEFKQKMIVQSLTQGEGRLVMKNILKRFGGKKVKSFVAAKKEDFAGQNELLEGVILGW